MQIGEDLFKAGEAAVFFYQDEAGSDVNTYVRRLEHLYEKDDRDKTKMAHVSWFAKGSETILGDVADEREVFRLVYCSEEKLSDVVGRASVKYWPQHEDWRNLGGNKEVKMEPPIDEANPNSYWYRMSYNPECARFEHSTDCSVASKELAKCSICPAFNAVKGNASVEAFGVLDDKCDEKGRFQWAGFRAMGERFAVGDAMFLTSHSSANASQTTKGRPNKTVDEDKYPEVYRYKSAVIKGSNERCPRPLHLGIIKEVYSVDLEGRKKVKICFRKLYRPEDTCLKAHEAFAKDLNLVYWSEDFISTDIVNVRGKVTVRAESALQQRPEDWRGEGTHRFYYKEAYNRAKRCFEELPTEAELYGVHGKGKGKGKGGKGDSAKSSSSPAVQDESALPKMRKRLVTLDVFSGCGGLSHGLHEAGVAESRWAIELFAPAANAFKANNPDCTVFTEDCNVLLDLAMKGKETNGKGQRLPRKGEIDLLCGGPPCQGFSGMNRFNQREYSAFKNSLCTTFLSYADFYRPRYFILENVRNFVSFKKSVVLKLCLRALLKIGYACTFGILQAGNFGVPQTRRRVIILAAAPGEELPLLPEPKHVFTKITLSVTIGDASYNSNCRWREEAPYRTITVQDCMTDLPSIGQKNEDVMSYGRDPISDFQRSMRRGVPDSELRDHVRKMMSCLVEKRIEYIPREAGSDWRDLPNILVKLADGTYADKLVYKYDDWKTGRSKKGVKRGVCACKNGKQGLSCDPGDKQGNTLIPWCLPHTSNRHNQWAGLYGRLEYDGFFSTTVTNPEPMGKQGRVLHPEENRLISVRECARSQGFPDSYKFYGTILEKHRQIGNAVPPPMGRAIGTEIRKAVAKAEKQKLVVINLTSGKGGSESQGTISEVKEEEKEEDIKPSGSAAN